VRVRQREEEAARLAGDAEVPRHLERVQRLEHHAERGEAEERRGADAEVQELSAASVVGRVGRLGVRGPAHSARNI
jgi:hypothetical protein